MTKGIIFALAANLIWGLIFVVPQMMDGFSPLEIALGRYFFYALISTLILTRALIWSSFSYPKSIWMKAFRFSFFTSFGYYPFVVLALRYATPAVCTLILGISPITIAIYGNWKQKEGNFRYLILPSILILIGLIIINAPQFFMENVPATFLLGLFCSLIALTTWSWYAVANSKLLKTHPEIAPGDWSTLLGVSTLVWVLLFGGIFGVFYAEAKDIEHYLTISPALIKFLTGSAVLGFLCSWVGAYLWNKASFLLPVSLAGQLMVFETIFGLLFVYFYEQNIPPLMEFTGIIILISAVLYGIRCSFRSNPESLSLLET